MAETEPDEATAHPLRDRLLRVYCRVLVFLTVYVLSTGPLYWYCYAGLKDASAVDGLTDLPAIGVFYYPLAWLCEQSDAVNRWFDWYVGLWI